MQNFKALVIAAITFMSFSAYGGEETAAFERLKKIAPKADWAVEKALKVDIDCDGKRDYVFLSQNQKYAQIGLVLGRKDGQSVFIQKIPFNKPNQDSLCEAPASIESESLDYDPTGAVGELPGFVPSKSCSSFILAGGECDVFHFFWNHKNNKPEWWRL
jgi:hypothetical protein